MKVGGKKSVKECEWELLCDATQVVGGGSRAKRR